MKYLAIFFFLITLSAKSFGAPGSAYGTISGITVKETGYIIVTLDAAHANPMSCIEDKKIAITNNHIAKKEILSVILSAFATKKRVGFWVTDCYEYYGTSHPLGITATIYDQ